ncbi:hypothetical protein H7J73_21745 [Mycolicibacterium komossense]|uniref:prolyl aminopeptidase n=1 Tax=Mycolicibacterium komossense TaxID=1779 RepID=A0ABT3CGZ2_9MYCO|nr:hypothetical protein [Mycolicibacterium komossense]
MLDVGDGNRVYWEACGNLTGLPALAVHGGPGSGCVPAMRRPFDPDKYRLVLFDQRGCGRSTPHAGDAAVDLTTNTTASLIHGRLDLSCPPDIAWELAQEWPAAELHIVPGAGHTAGGQMGEHAVEALDRFAEYR